MIAEAFFAGVLLMVAGLLLTCALVVVAHARMPRAADPPDGEAFRYPEVEPVDYFETPDGKVVVFKRRA